MVYEYKENMFNGMSESNQIIKNLLQENDTSPNTTTTASPDASSTTSDSPTPTNSIREKNWVNHYQSIGDEAICEERQLLGTEEEQRELLGTEEESSDRHSSDYESDIEDVWAITDEQHDYYENQFKTLQPNINSLLNGIIARQYFEKSRLTIEELRKIWQLADVTKDGALSLAEFKVAMHLVVVRRHDIPIPDILPQSLVSTAPLRTSPLGYNTATSLPKGKEWTKFSDSPTNSLPSPGPKPVNFDFSRASIVRNPKILHPIALRLTPASDILVEDTKNEIKKNPCTTGVDSEIIFIKAIQRPQPKKHSAPGPGAIPPPPHSITEENSGLSGPTSLPLSASKKEPPPPPPPRPNRTHIRSSSLDLNKLGRNINNIPSVPPRISPGMVNNNCGHPYFVDFNRNISHGAFHVYKKTELRDTNTKPTAAQLPIEEKHVIPPKTSVAEGNKYLRNFCRELQEELNVLREKRSSLQCQLEKLHSHSPPAAPSQSTS